MGHSAAAVLRRHQIGCKKFRERRLQFQHNGSLLTQIHLLQCNALPMPGADQQISGAGFKPGKTIPVGAGFPERIQLAIIDDLELHQGIGYAPAVGGDLYGKNPGAGVAAGTVDGFIEGAACPAFGIHQHGPGSRGGEPAPVQHGFRLTGTQIVPASVDPHLHPGVIVITMGPTGAIALPGGNAHAAQCGYGQNTFLTAASPCAPQHSQRAQGAVIGGGVGSVGIAPIVDGQGGLGHGLTLDMGQQFPEQKTPAAIGIFRIDPVVQHIGKENLSRNCLAVRDRPQGFQSGLHISGKDLHGDGQHILGCHVAVEILHAQRNAVVPAFQKCFHFLPDHRITGDSFPVLPQDGGFILGCHGKFHGRSSFQTNFQNRVHRVRQHRVGPQVRKENLRIITVDPAGGNGDGPAVIQQPQGCHLLFL